MMKVVVFGATGVVGGSAARHFVNLDETVVVGISRRPPRVAGVHHVPIDLSDRQGSAETLRSEAFSGTTHIIFAALQEANDLTAGWRDHHLMQYNLRLFENSLEPLIARHGSSLRHVSLLQGAKAYGFHLGRSPIPAKERARRDDHDNFYFLQEDALKRMAKSGDWSWTILRPQVVYGDSIGSPMNLLPAIGVYASVERERGRPLSFPGGEPSAQEAVDARLLAKALAWAAESPRLATRRSTSLMAMFSAGGTCGRP
jgi:nucleoside-diphosphate-sugar epimerase